MANICPKGHPDAVILVDDKDLHLFEGMTVYYHPGSRPFPFVRKKGRTVSVHSLILNPPPYAQVDHINHDPLDNRRRNLRIVTHRINALNRRAASAVALGVSRDRRKFQMTFKRRRPARASFSRPDLAARAYDEAKRAVGAPALSCNFPERPGETLAARHPFSRDECEAAARRHLPLYENFARRKNNPCDGVAIWALARYHIVLNRTERPRTIDNTPCPSRTLQVRYKGRSVAEAGPGQEAPRFFDETDQWRLWHLIDLLEARAPQPITTDLSGSEDDA